MTTAYNGRDKAVTVAGNVVVNAMPAIAGYDTRKLTTTEWDAGTTIECNIRKIEVTADAGTRTDQYLCDDDQIEERGPIKWQVAPIEINAGDPQKPDAWLAALTVGQTLFLGQRYGLPYTAPAASAQIANQVTKVEVSAIEWVAPEANANGSKFFKKISFAVKGNELDVPITVAP